jgi:hypothetical protein
MEATPPAAVGGEAAVAAASGATAEAPSAELAMEGVAAIEGAATAELAGAPGSGPQPLKGDEPEVVHGRRLLSSSVEVPLPRLLVRAQRAMEEAEAGFRREWETLEAERLQLSNWERRLGDRIQTVASHAAKERAQLEWEREVQREKMCSVIDREMAVATREKAVTRKEMEVELKERSARHAIDTSKVMVKTIDDKRAALNLREVAVQEEEARLTTLRADLEACSRGLEEREAKEEGFLVEQRVGVERIMKWVDEASTTLEPLGLSPIQVVEAPSSLSVVLPILDSAAEHLQRLESTLVAHLEAEGWELARVVVDHVLTCFRSHDPTISLTPVLEGPVLEAEAAAREGVQEVVEIVAARFEL